MGFLSNLFSGIKNLFGGAGQAAQGAAKSIGGAVSSLANPVSAGLKAGQGLISGFNPMSMFGGNKAIGNQNPPALSMPIGGNQGISLANYQSPAMSGISTGSAPGFENDTNPNKKKSNDWMSQLFPGGIAPGIAGLAAPAIGDLFAPKSPNIPDFNSLSSVQALQNFRPGNSVSPEYQKMIQNNVNQLRDQKVRELQALYHNARPGTDYLTDTNYQRDLALLDQGVQNNLTDELAKAEGTFSSQEQQRLSELANLDIFQIMQQTGMKAQEAQQFKEMFSNVGNMFLTNATRDNSFEKDLMERLFPRGVGA